MQLLMIYSNIKIYFHKWYPFTSTWVSFFIIYILLYLINMAMKVQNKNNRSPKVQNLVCFHAKIWFHKDYLIEFFPLYIKLIAVLPIS